MTHNANHVTDHNELRALVATELARFGLGNTLGGPWNPGDPDHVGRHNAMVDALAAVATAAGRTYTSPLPPHRALGQTGHIADHDAMRAAVVEAATWPAWNAATGGTVTDVPNYNGTGQTWRVHRITANTDFVVSSGRLPFRVLMVGGGGAGGGNAPNDSYGAAGGGGAGRFWTGDLTITAGTYPVTIGNGGVGSRANGGATSFRGITMPGGGGGNSDGGGNGGSGGSGGGAGAGFGNSYGGAAVPGSPAGFEGLGTAGQNGGALTPNGGGGGGHGGGATASAQSGATSDITGTALEYARGGAFSNARPAPATPIVNRGNGGQGSGGAQVGASGDSGAVIIAYRIG